jgi:hypothetical protein
MALRAKRIEIPPQWPSVVLALRPCEKEQNAQHRRSRASVRPHNSSLSMLPIPRPRLACIPNLRFDEAVTHEIAASLRSSQ